MKKKKLIKLVNKVSKQAALTNQVLYFLTNRMKNDESLSSKLTRYTLAKFCREMAFSMDYEEGIKSLNHYIESNPIKYKKTPNLNQERK